MDQAVILAHLRQTAEQAALAFDSSRDLSVGAAGGSECSERESVCAREAVPGPNGIPVPGTSARRPSMARRKARACADSVQWILHLRSTLTLAVLPPGLASPAFSQTVTESFTHQGKTLLYRYDRGDLANAAGTPGLLLYFHGRSPGTQEQVLDLFHDLGQEIAEEQGLVRVTLASPGLRGKTLGDTGTRQWHAEDIPVVHEFLRTALSAQFRFDANRIVFWGASEEACFLNDFIPSRGASYGGGLYAACGCFNRDPEQAWTPPADFRTRFRVLVRSTSGDDFRQDSAAAYYFYKYKAGLEAFVDLSGEGDQCEPGAVSDADAIAWLLGTRSLAVRATDGPSESHPPWQLREPPEEDPAACQPAAALVAKRGQGTGNALWVSPQAVASLPQFETNYRIEAVAGSWIPGGSGDDGPAMAARLRFPRGVAVDTAGNVNVTGRCTSRTGRRSMKSGRQGRSTRSLTWRSKGSVSAAW